MIAEEFGAFQDHLGNDHREGAAVLLKVDVNAEPDPGASTEVMSVRLIHADSPEELLASTLRAKKLWMYRDEAVSFVSLILDAALNGAQPGEEEQRLLGLACATALPN